jgi:hypothetical protein
MPFEKGKSGNPGGRPKGAKDKATRELRDWVQRFLERKTYDLEKSWKELKPEQKFALFEKLLAYTLPKPQTIDLNIDLERLSEEQLDQIINKLINSNE